MILYVKKFFTAFSCFLLIPAIGCLCCEVSHADEVSHNSNASSCCQEDKEQTSHDETPCCSDCFIQGFPKESTVYVFSAESRSSETQDTFEPFYNAWIIAQIADYSIQEFSSPVVYSILSLTLIRISSYPIQGRSPPILS